MSVVIETHELTKHFNGITAVDQINLEIESGRIFGLLGPNAAGKSTAIRLLTGLLTPDAGSIRILDMDLSNNIFTVKNRIGYVAQHFALYPELSAYENLSFYSGLYQDLSRKQVLTILEQFNLGHMADQRAGTLSGGYKRRLSIACAISHDPDLIFLDEPTAGIDPVTRKELWDQFYNLAVTGKTLFITTHYMEEAERCHQLAFMDHGKLIADATPQTIKESFNAYQVYASQVNYDPAMLKSLRQIGGILVLNQVGSELRIVTDDSANRNSIESCLKKHNGSAENLHVVSPTIEDVFMTMTRELPA